MALAPLLRMSRVPPQIIYVKDTSGRYGTTNSHNEKYYSYFEFPPQVEECYKRLCYFALTTEGKLCLSLVTQLTPSLNHIHMGHSINGMHKKIVISVIR